MLPEIKKILYITDLTKNSEYAYKYALICADRHNAIITVLHIIEDIYPSEKAVVEPFLQSDHYQKKVNESINHIKKRLQAFCDKYNKESPECSKRVESVMVYEGNPAEEILIQAKNLSADIIVMGSHGKGFILRHLLGSVAKRVVEHSRIPVFVIPLPEDEIDVTFHGY